LIDVVEKKETSPFPLSLTISIYFLFWCVRLVLQRNEIPLTFTFGKMILSFLFKSHFHFSFSFFYNFMTTLKLKCVHDTVLIFFWIIFTIFFHFTFLSLTSTGWLAWRREAAAEEMKKEILCDDRDIQKRV
jgi:hypothetical protein